MIPDGRPLGKWLQEARVAKRLTMSELAPLLNMEPARLNDIESGLRMPSETVIKEFATAHGLDFDEAMARAGRLSEASRDFLKCQPCAALLVGRMAAVNFPLERIQEFIREVEKFG